ncbi:MAG: hypothetical protein GY724_24460 [Actinomycetia bacterium]|nr:hypothetical protein [Actinomycetes bacterium]MCP4228193.1 hypothetical protein [Actinomycetes bacterium]MCP5030420.1 hypothetical protein [Actinomycetes bacterium]
MFGSRQARRWLRLLRSARPRPTPDQHLRAAREIIGPTGNFFSAGWEQFEKGHAGYLRSFQPRVPPSIHISHRDKTRANLPIPLSERCLEDHAAHYE